MIEDWSKMVGVGDLYAISTLGRVWSARYGLMKTPANNDGYPHCNVKVNCKNKKFLVHREMGKSFLPNPENKKTINHKNGIRNDNRIENLEWATSAEQNQHSVLVLGRKGAPNYSRRKQVVAIREDSSIVLEFNGIRDCGRKLGIPYQGVQNGLRNSNLSYFGWMFR